MRIKVVAAILLLAGMTGGASAMPVATFLAKADGLKKLGPLALVSGDYKLLTGSVKADAAALLGERRSARASGRVLAYCPPAPVNLSLGEILDA